MNVVGGIFAGALLGSLAVAMASPTMAQVSQVSPGSLTATGLVTFDDVAGGDAPGTNYNALFVSGNVAFGERFQGQTLVPSGTFDTLTGAPTAGLTLLTGATDQNLNIFTFSTQVLTGLGPLGFPDFDAIGEGAIALRFGLPQSQFGFELVGGGGGTAEVNFYAIDGSLIDSINLTGLSDQAYAFLRDGNVADIAGITITNNDASGIGFDNLRYNTIGGDPLPTSTPEPASLVLLAAGLVALGAARRRR